MRKIIRITIAVLFLIPSYPFLFIIYSVFTIVVWIGFISFLNGFIFGYILDDDELIKTGKDSFEMMIMPVNGWINFINGIKKHLNLIDIIYL